MKLKLLVLLIFVLSLPALYAQSSDEIMVKVLSHFKSSKNVCADFELSTPQYKTKGSFILSGEKFRILSDDFKCWYDGKTQWVYTTATEEVNLIEPTDEELQMSNPYIILMGYNRNFTSQLMSSRGSHYILRLNAKNTAAEISQVELTVDKSSYRIVKAVFLLSDGVKQEIKFSNYSINKNITDKVFVFDAHLVPAGTSVIDIR